MSRQLRSVGDLTVSDELVEQYFKLTWSQGQVHQRLLFQCNNEPHCLSMFWLVFDLFRMDKDPDHSKYTPSYWHITSLNYHKVTKDSWRVWPIKMIRSSEIKESKGKTWSGIGLNTSAFVWSRFTFKSIRRYMLPSWLSLWWIQGMEIASFCLHTPIYVAIPSSSLLSEGRLQNGQWSIVDYRPEMISQESNSWQRLDQFRQHIDLLIKFEGERWIYSKPFPFHR